jgi:hypothetical protein
MLNRKAKNYRTVISIYTVRHNHIVTSSHTRDKNLETRKTHSNAQNFTWRSATQVTEISWYTSTKFAQPVKLLTRIPETPVRFTRWPRHLGRRSAAARLLGLRVRIPLEAWMFVLCVVHADKRLNARQWRQRNKDGLSTKRVQENTKQNLDSNTNHQDWIFSSYFVQSL